MNELAELFWTKRMASRRQTEVIDRRASGVNRLGVLQSLQIVLAASAAILVSAVIGWNLALVGMPTIPPPDQLWTLNREPAVQFLDSRGETLAVRGHLYGPVVRSVELPPYVAQAFIAAEDQRFMEHSGIDLQSILRAVVAVLSG